ncbi:hypothetical protein JCM15548_14197 [Geofilum rubicundum JCM 15548]|uniref:Uncharacterized protein n=1 Tax=Geofilum rubicundum JCM 15548 TaxID=1236989 RepID=A0A0E9M2P2_9BACT|nr:hypothetical protein JCM15548_14197 [Geofilum rubicundum JCM 15548]
MYPNNILQMYDYFLQKLTVTSKKNPPILKKWLTDFLNPCVEYIFPTYIGTESFLILLSSEGSF